MLGAGWTPLDALLPAKIVAGLLRDVTSAKDELAEIAALGAFFAAHLLNRALDGRLGKALREVFARRGDVSIAELARRSGTHTRTLVRLFDHAVGLSPKRFARIVRLQAALRALPAGGSWAGVALELGYCDQAHFIREVRELFGTTPREIMRLREPDALRSVPRPPTAPAGLRAGAEESRRASLPNGPPSRPWRQDGGRAPRICRASTDRP